MQNVNFFLLHISIHLLTRTDVTKKPKSILRIHCKKRLATFPSSASGMSLTKLLLGRNDLIIPAQGEFGK
jgi:hypothetical protein